MYYTFTVKNWEDFKEIYDQDWSWFFLQVESHHHRSQEEEVHHAAQLSETELELAEQLPKLISKLKEDETKGMLNKIRLRSFSLSQK